MIDIDSFIGEVHGSEKQGAGFGYTAMEIDTMAKYKLPVVAIVGQAATMSLGGLHPSGRPGP